MGPASTLLGMHSHSAQPVLAVWFTRSLHANAWGCCPRLFQDINHCICFGDSMELQGHLSSEEEVVQEVNRAQEFGMLLCDFATHWASCSPSAKPCVK